MAMDNCQWKLYDQKTIGTACLVRLWQCLLNDPEVKGLRINVTTLRGVVMLEGRVPSDYAREKAIRITRETGSVVDVDDRLTVVE